MKKHMVTVREARELSKQTGALIFWRPGHDGAGPLTDDDLCEVLYVPGA